MLLAYIDEIGETGAFVSRDHARYNTSAAFGYAGFIIPSSRARQFGAIFTTKRNEVFRSEIEGAEHPGRWERKGASIFRPQTAERYPQQLRVFDALVRTVTDLHGELFYYADEKPVGTPKQTQLDTTDRETRAMREALNRIARHADHRDTNVMVMIDQVNEATRAERLPRMYAHILSRATDYEEMRRIIEPPMHIDSKLSSNIQFADWVAACVSRAIDYQLVQDSPHAWVTKKKHLKSPGGAFTHESKVHLWHRSVEDLVHSRIFHTDRVLYPVASNGCLIGESVDPNIFRRIKAAAERSRTQ